LNPLLGNLSLETLMAHTPVGLAVSNAQGVVELCSPALDAMLGRPTLQGQPQDVWTSRYDMYAADGVTPLRPEDFPLVRAVNGEVVTDAVIVSVRGDGRRLYLRCNASPLRDESDEIVGAVVLVQDVTAEQTAHEAQILLRDQLVETVNHEIRTPLAKIIGHAELIQDQRENLLPTISKSVDTIVSAAADLYALADDISDLAELEAGSRLSRTFGNIAGLLREVVARHEPKALRRGVHIDCQAPRRVNATVDPRQLERAVAALIDNAVGHAPPASCVEVVLSVDDGFFEISVRDRGPGIDATDWPRLVQPFERGTVEASRGSARGLGLALASTVAAAHGGELLLRDAGGVADGSASEPTTVVLRQPRFS
jgi:signal transduction histidine kinase